MIALLVANWGYIATALWAASEILNQIPSIKSNTVLELLINVIESVSSGHVVSPDSAASDVKKK